MNSNNLNKIIERYLNLFQKRKISDDCINNIESKLNIVLPEDFKAISKVFDGYEEIACQSLFSFDSAVEDWNIVSKTLFYRESDCKLPKRYLALREESENFVVMETQQIASETARVIWCSLSDAYNLEDTDKMSDNPVIFPSFAHYFDYLVTTEEEKRKG